MQTKLKPLFLLVTLAATAMLLYAANEARAQSPSIGIFDVSAFSPNVITIGPKLVHPVHATPPVDSTTQHLQSGKEFEIHSDY